MCKFMDMKNPSEQPPRPRLDPGKLRLYRDAALLTQEELAERAGTTRTSVSRHEGGHKEPRPSQIRRYAEALSRRPQELLREAA